MVQQRSTRQPRRSMLGLILALALIVTGCTTGPAPSEPEHRGLHSSAPPAASPAATPGVAGPVPALPAGVSVAANLPRPTEVAAFGDDRVITVTWKGVFDERVVGYYVLYRQVGTTQLLAIQTHARRGQFAELDGAVQLQPVVNGKAYEIWVASASGDYAQFPVGALDGEGGARSNFFARADGKVSAFVGVSAVASDARVAAMRQRLTGFFDDFNTPEGPFDETKWNQAMSACVLPGMGGAFINNQFHAHNMVRSDCDRAGVVSRPRATFDLGGATDERPAQIEFDIDGTTQPRDTWYLDLVPVSARANGLPVDITSHNSIFDDDTQGPGSMLRVNVLGSSLTLASYDRDQRPRALATQAEPTQCKAANEQGTGVDYTSCDLSAKKSGFSPLPQPSIRPVPLANVRRHWVLQFTDDQLKIYIDSALVAAAELPADVLAEQRFTVHTTSFSYSTGKSYIAPTESQPPGTGPVKYGAYTYSQMVHWDNFGFTGAAPTERIANYLEAGPGGQPIYGMGSLSYTLPAGPRTAVVKIPDPIGAPLHGKARLFFTVQQFGYSTFRLGPNDQVVVNGSPVPVRSLATRTYRATAPDAITPESMSVIIDSALLRTGDNQIEFRLTGAGDNPTPADVLNVHIEVPYALGDTNPYSPPMMIFGHAFHQLVHPPMTNCDTYNTVESDLGLPYPDGRANLQVGECRLR